MLADGWFTKRISKMRRNITWRGAFGHKLTALLLLVLSLLLPVAPLLQASLASKAESCQCCRRTGATRYSQKPHRHSTAGPSWNAAIECASGCAQRAVVPSLSFLVVESDSTTAAQPAIADLIEASCLHRAHFWVSTSLHQRPPPLG